MSENKSQQRVMSERLSSLSTFLLTTALLQEDSIVTRIEFQNSVYDNAGELWLITWKFNITDEEMKVRLTKEEIEKFVHSMIHTLKYFDMITYKDCLEIRLGVKHKIFP